MEYEIISARTTLTVEKYVRASFAEGWVPCGGVSFGKDFFVQAVMRDPGRKRWFEMEQAAAQAAARARDNGTSGE